MVTHEPDIAAHARRVVVLRDGVVASDERRSVVQAVRTDSRKRRPHSVPFFEAVRLAFATIRVQKLKSFFTLLGVMIGVMFLIAVVTIVEGMSRYMEDDFAGALLGVNTFTLRRGDSGFGPRSDADWREIQRRPRLYKTEVDAVRAALPRGLVSSIENMTFAYASSPLARPKQVQVVSAEESYFTLKKYKLTSGRPFSSQEVTLGSKVLVIGSEAASHFFPGLDPLGRELRIGGIAVHRHRA